MLRSIINRLREPSSLAGLAAVLALTGHGADAQAWTDAGAAVLGLLAVLLPEGRRDA